MAGVTGTPPQGPQPTLNPLLAEDPKEIGGYRLVGRIGSGGMGVVFAAAAPGGGYLAVKVIHTDYAADTDFRARFAREVELAHRVRSPRVPAFYGADTEAASPWLATEYVPGKTLREHITAHGPLRGGMLLGFAAGVAEALRVVHAAGIVHRDLKPGNVILAADGPKVLDFGIARAVEETALTRTGGLVGTPGWISPEQYQGTEITSAADMFAWGGLVAFAATGANPFGIGAPNALAYRVLRGEPDLTGVPEDVLPLVTAALNRDPAGRPTAADAVQAVHSLWSGVAGQVAPAADEATAVVQLLGNEWTEVRTHIPAPPRRGRRGLLIAGAAGALVLALAGTAAAVAIPRMVGGETAETAEIGEAAGGENNEESGEQSGETGSDSGDDAGDGSAAAADAEPEETELPVEATDFASTGGSAPNSAEVISAGETAEVDLLYSGGFAASKMRLNGVETASGGVELALEITQDGANPGVFPELSSEWFYIHGGDGELTPANSFAYPTDNSGGQMAGLDHSESHTLVFPDAPDSGLLTLRATAPSDSEIYVPPISVCYDVTSGFSTDYESCV